MSTDAAGTTRPEEVRRREVAELLRRAQDGDRAAMEAIVRRLTPLVWNVARAQGVDRETAMDVVQTVWLSLLDHLSRIRTHEALAGWLVTVTRREARRVRTEQRRHLPTEPQDLRLDEPDPAADVESLVGDREQHGVLWRNLRKLNRRCQELLRTVAFGERPDYRVISEALGMPKGSIGPTRGRCLARLRTLLTDDPGWSPR